MGDQREFQIPGHGLKCGKCKGLLTRITRTIKTPGFITRERICPHCGELNTTNERVIGNRQRRGYFTSEHD